MAPRPRSWRYHAAWAHLELHETTRASQYINEFLDIAPNDPGGLMTSLQALLQARYRNDKQAGQAIEQALSQRGDYGHFHHTEYNIACAYALLGKPEEARHWLSEAIHDGFDCTPLFRSDPNLRSLPNR
jgi:predicted Zn-dependent protease